MFDRMEGEGREKKERKREEKKGEYCVWIEEGKERVIYLSFTWLIKGIARENAHLTYKNLEHISKFKP